MNLSRKACSSNSAPSGRIAARLPSAPASGSRRLNLSPARRWDFSLSSIQRSSQIRLGAMLIDRFFVSHAAGRMNGIELRDFHTAVDDVI